MEETKAIVGIQIALLVVFQLHITLSKGEYNSTGGVPIPITHDPSVHCYDGTNYTSRMTQFEKNLNWALSILKNVSSSSYFYSTSVGMAPDKAYATYMCHYDLPLYYCGDCIDYRVKVSLQNNGFGRTCKGYWEVASLGRECVVHYANRSIFSQVDLTFSTSVCDYPSLNDMELNKTVRKTISRLINNVTNSRNSFFAMGEETYMVDQSVHALVQCVPYINARDCRKCLSAAINHALSSCQVSVGASCSYATCTVRYSLYTFNLTNTNNYYTNTSGLSLQHQPPSPIPPTSSSLTFRPDIFIKTTVWIVLLLVLELRQRVNCERSNILTEFMKFCVYVLIMYDGPEILSDFVCDYIMTFEHI